MAAARLDLTIEQGANWRPLFTWHDSAGDPVDLTSYSARLQVRATKASATKLLDLTDGNSKLVLGGSAGTIQVEVDDTETAALSFVRGYYDLEVELSSKTTRLAEGKVTLVKEVTR